MVDSEAFTKVNSLGIDCSFGSSLKTPIIGI
jgi:hypothetical protein